MKKKSCSLAVGIETEEEANKKLEIKEAYRNEIKECLKTREIKRCEECCRYNEGCKTLERANNA